MGGRHEEWETSQSKGLNWGRGRAGRLRENLSLWCQEHQLWFLILYGFSQVIFLHFLGFIFIFKRSLQPLILQHFRAVAVKLESASDSPRGFLKTDSPVF